MADPARDRSAFDVAIVGFGPTGATLANLLGRDGVRTVVVEREPEVYALPRAVHFDHEVMRIFQSAGLAQAILLHTGPVRRYDFRNADGKTLLCFDLRDRVTEQGWRPDYMFHQPALEAALREGAAARQSVELCLGLELTSLAEEEEGVALGVRDRRGAERTLRARYAVGCDGASSLTRRLAGLPVQDLCFDEPWLVVDATVAGSPAGLGLPDAPLQRCDPARPTTFVPVTGSYVRWEFMLLPGEGDEMKAEGRVRELLAEWVDPEAVEVIRSAIYRFHALIGERWRTRRVLLAGDAVHQMPPFLGQGMCAGIRDAANLAWKLGLVLRGAAGDDLLDSYPQERAPHVRRVIDLAIELGRIICTRDPALAAARDAQLLGAAAGPALAVPSLPGIAEGFLQAEPRHPLAGTLGLQARVRARGGREGLLDDLVGPGFRLLWNGAAAPLADPDAAVLERLGARQVAVLRPGQHVGSPREPLSLEDADAAYADWFERHAIRAVLTRPDHVVFGAAGSDSGVPALLRSLGAALCAA